MSLLDSDPNQLPLWPVALRGMPNAFARSALFTVANLRQGERIFYSRKQIIALSGIEMRYSGAELRSDDEDVFLQMLHQARLTPLGTQVTFASRTMLKALGWSLNTASTNRLIDCLVRLRGATVEVNIERPNGQGAGFAETLVRSFKWKRLDTNELLREWTVELEPTLIKLFDPQSYSRLDWELRLSLPPLAKYLHKFYHSHATPFPMKVETLHALTGSGMSVMRQFRLKLQAALDLLVASGFLLSATIDKKTGLVTVVRTEPLKLPLD
jgi:hypothetical protein